MNAQTRRTARTARAARAARTTVGAGLGALLAGVTVLAPPATAATPTAAERAASEPVAPCVTHWQSWRYTQVTNDCATSLDVKVVYEDGAEGLCHPAQPGTTTTIGEGYTGRHGHVAYVATC
ncbi:alpha-amylase [Streptomyces kanasensis]|uniref:alpha-amylase n=1 Tax=Streptomyces kanasensis TaxID=936756 RepID=UPI0036F8437C